MVLCLVPALLVLVLYNHYRDVCQYHVMFILIIFCLSIYGERAGVWCVDAEEGSLWCCVWYQRCWDCYCIIMTVTCVSIMLYLFSLFSIYLHMLIFTGSELGNGYCGWKLRKVPVSIVFNTGVVGIIII